MIYNKDLYDYKNICVSCTIYIVLFFIAFLIIISISSAFIYFHWYLKNDACITNINLRTEKVIYQRYKRKTSSKLILKTV